MKYEEALVVKAAWYYYVENMTQQKISEKLGISRMRVIRLLEKAKQDGVIQFKISKERSHHLQIEQEVIKTWGLKDAFIIPDSPEPAGTNDSIAKAAAMYLSDRLEPGAYLNIGYGDTPSRILNHLTTIIEQPVSMVSLTGGVSYYLQNNISSVNNAKLYLYPTPLKLSSKDMRDAILNESGVQEIGRMVRLASMTIVGIGGMSEDATIITNGILNKNDFLYLSMQGAVGDLLTHFIDKDGNPIVSEIDDKLVSTSLDILKELDNVIGVAAGPNKTEAIRAVLKGGYIDVLITDEETAMKLTQ